MYGIAFAISGEAAISYLSQREVKLGGYDTKFATFHPSNGAPIKNVLLYVATPANSLWLGEAPLTKIASEITETRGLCGHNVEYLLRLANFMRQYCPGIEDPHLFKLEAAVLRMISERNMCIKSLMGDGRECVTFKMISSLNHQSLDNRLNYERGNNFQFTTQMSSKSLRCVRI